MEPPIWNERVRNVLEAYDETLLRGVTQRLCRPRNLWPASELIDRCVDTLQNPAVLDRRLKDQSVGARRVLGLLRRSDRTIWTVGSLCELGALLEVDFGPESVAGLVEGGLVFPEIATGAKLKNLDIWLAQNPSVFVPPIVPQRLEAEPFVADLTPVTASGPTLEADGLEWPLRLAVAHQILQGGPLRRTQTRDFFKRDLDRVRGENLLGTPPSDALDTLPDADLFTVALALSVGIFGESDGEVRTLGFPASWNAGLARTLGEIWAALPNIADWGPVRGWEIRERPIQPFASSWLYALGALGAMPADAWVRTDEIQKRVAMRHPFFADAKDPSATGVTHFLLAIAYPLRLLQATKTADGYAVRLSPLGRQILHFGGVEVTLPTFPKALLVQPNLEILAYRQGLTTELIPQLGGFATWKTIGAACTLQFEPESVYRALEGGMSLEGIVQTLDRYGMKPTPPAVLDALRTWANKRDRITLYPSGALFEFATPADLDEALNRGLPAVRLTDRLAVAPRESDVDFKHFRLTGTRDYSLPPERCVEVEADGVSLIVDLARSDLLLETELLRFAEASTRLAPPGKKHYKMTANSLRSARQQGMTWAVLEAWFEQRTGMPGSPAAKFLFGATDVPPFEFRRQIVLHVAAVETADGLLQWPGTQTYLQGRLGPTALVVAENDVEPLAAVLRDLGIAVRFEQV
jgi:XPB/Ssl2-like helicase family protein